MRRPKPTPQPRITAQAGRCPGAMSGRGEPHVSYDPPRERDVYVCKHCASLFVDVHKVASDDDGRHDGPIEFWRSAMNGGKP